MQLKYFKYIFNIKKSTPSCMVYGELGITPLKVDISTRIVSFWSKLVNNIEYSKLSSLIYSILFVLYNAKQIKSQWIENVKDLLCEFGFSGIWITQSFLNSKWLIAATKQKAIDLYIQNWHSIIEASSNCNSYKVFKTKFEQNPCINLLPSTLCMKYIRFRTRNHKFPIETGRWSNICIRQKM